jgi:3-dehydroquinate synthase
VSVRRRDDYDIIIRRGVVRECGDFIAPVLDHIEANSVVIITDERVDRVVLPELARSLTACRIPAEVIVLQPGERSKSLPTVERLLQELRHRGVERRTVLVAVGGGVLCDLVGFVAAVFMRGLPYINVPTSLMAQVDAAIGGKVGVNHQSAKNLIGALYHPAQVLVDPELPTSLPLREISNGLAEVVKVGVIADPCLFELLERSADSGPALPFEEIIRRAIVAKLQLLSDDPFERDLRRLLNFGHSVGHALEAATGYRKYRHGEAVSIGIATATQVAVQKGVCGGDTGQRIIGTLTNLRLPTAMTAEHHDAVWDNIGMIQRIRNGSLNFVVPRSIGECDILESLTYEGYRHAVEALERGNGACSSD